MKPLDPRLLRWARATGVFLAASVLGGSVTAVAVIVQAYLLARIITDVFWNQASLADVNGSVVALAAVIVVRAGLAFGLDWMAFRSAARAKSQLRMAVLEHVVALGPAATDQRTPGELTQLTGRGIDALDAYFARYLPQLVLAAIVPAAIIAVVLTQDVLAAVIIVLTLPLIPVFMILIGLSTQRQVDRQWRTLGVLSGHFLDVVAGLPTLKIFGRAKAQSATLRTIGDRYRRATLRVLRVSFVSALALELLATLSVAIVAVSIGLRLVNGDMDLFTGLWVLILAPEAYLPLRMVGVHFHAAADGITAAQRLLDLLEEPLPQRPAAPAPARVGAPQGLAVDLSDVTVTYPGRTLPALDRFSIQARPGAIVALAGDSGAGKSTVLRTLLGFVEVAAGTVTTGASSPGNGRQGAGQTGAGWPQWTLAATPERQWLEQFAWLPQEPIMVAGTVADNIRLGKPAATDAEVAQAAVAAGLVTASPPLPPARGVPFAGRRPGAGGDAATNPEAEFDSGAGHQPGESSQAGADPGDAAGSGTGSGVLRQAVAEGGAGVSAGQRRRIGLARILVRDAPIVLLDEPSAALDEETEAIVVGALGTLRERGRTVVVVAHRPGLLQVADRVVSLEPVDADAVLPLAEDQVALPGLGR